MKQYLSLIAILAILCSCASTPLQTAAKTIASSQLTVDATMKGWATYVVLNRPPPQQEDAVRDSYGKYQVVMKTCKVLYAEAATQPTNAPALDATVALLQASQGNLVGLIQTFSTVNK